MKSLRSKLRRFVKHDLRLFTLKKVIRWPWLSDVYYCFDPSYRREHRASIYGKFHHLSRDVKYADSGRSYTLRRNVHRLEKGLIMRPRRAVFARATIDETVGVFVDSVDSQIEGDESATLLNKWACDVLHRYFEVVGEDDVVEESRRKFEGAVQRLNLDRGDKVPYSRDLSPLKTSYEDMLDLAYRRRSVRWYLPEPVPRELIDKALQVALYSPSACNRQPFEFRVFDDPELARKIGSIPMGTSGFADNFTCVVVLVGRLRAYHNENDRHVIYIDSSLAAMAFQFALETQGLSSCCINWPDQAEREKKIAQLLNLDPDERVIMFMSVGYPDPKGEVPYSQKKSLDEIRSYNRL